MSQGSRLSAGELRREDSVLITDWLWPFLTSGFRWDEPHLPNPSLRSCVCAHQVLLRHFLFAISSQPFSEKVSFFFLSAARTVRSKQGAFAFKTGMKDKGSDRAHWEPLNTFLVHYSWGCCSSVKLFASVDQECIFFLFYFFSGETCSFLHSPACLRNRSASWELKG